MRINQPVLQQQRTTNESEIIMKSTKELYEFMNAFGNMDEDGNVTLPDDTTLNLKTISGASVFSMKLMFLSANKDLIDNIYNVIKSLDAKLGQMVSSP